MDELAITKKIMKELGENFSIAKLSELAANEIRRQEIIEGKAPDDEPAEDPADEVAASATPEAEAAVVDLADGSEGAVDGAVDGDEVAGESEAMFTDFAQGLADELGVDLPALLASFEESRDAVLAALGSAPEEGTAADDESMAAMSKSHSGAITSLAKSEAKSVELSKRVAILEAAGELAAFEVELSRHCVATEILDQTRIELMKTATDADYGDKALTVARKQLAAALETGTGVPVKLAYKPGKPAEGADKRDQKGEVAELTARELCFYETHRALNKSHADALTFALTKSA